MLWFTFSTSKPQKVEAVELHPKYFGYYNKPDSAEYAPDRKPRPLSCHDFPNSQLGGKLPTPPSNPHHLPPIIDHAHTRSRSVSQEYLSVPTPDANVITIAPASGHSRSQSHSGVVQAGRKPPVIEQTPTQGRIKHSQVQARPSRSLSRPKQIEYIQVRSQPTRSQSRSRQLEWVRKRRSTSPRRIRSKSRGRSVIRDRIIEVVEPQEPPRSRSPVYCNEYDETDDIFDPDVHEVESYYKPGLSRFGHRESVMDHDIHGRAARAVPSPSIRPRGGSVSSSASSSLRSTRSGFRQPIHALEGGATQSHSRGSSTPRSINTSDSDKASVSTAASSIPSPSSSSSATGESRDTKQRIVSITRDKYCYTPAPDREPSLRAYNRLKIVQSRKGDYGSGGSEIAIDEDRDDEEDKALRRILKVTETSRVKSRSASRK
ncbi:MAG: hypothetical protein LQ340_001241 [Diploschistes diacapsis]|nr:MAG: hypothetical protein LQ340_001241 [Diploschistes diacapsis]